ncbi:MAG: radical SAM protein [Bryobacteraceae bacterium]|nr:radical SAM protein [Bryobacteraceae bacterium]
MLHAFPVLANSIFGREPTTTVLFVTNRCNLDCQMCFYTAREKRAELTTQEVARLARSMPSQWYVMFTGDEPFLRPDLSELVTPFYDCGAANLHISSNCTYFDRTVSGIRRIATHARNARVILATSIDGPAEVHDRIRGAKMYEKTVATVRRLITLKRQLPNLAVLANFTFCSANQHYWRETVEYLRQELKVDLVNIGLVRGRVKDPSTKRVDLEEYRRATEYLGSLNQRSKFRFPLGSLVRFKEAEQAAVIYRIAKGDAPSYYRCFAGRVFHVITETGEIYPCEMLSEKLGNLRDVDMDFMALWRSARAKQITDLVDKRECLCTYECAIGPSLATNPATPGRFARYLLHKHTRIEQCAFW